MGDEPQDGYRRRWACVWREPRHADRLKVVPRAGGARSKQSVVESREVIVEAPGDAACQLMGQVLSGDKDIGHILPIPSDTMQLFDECRGASLLSLPSTMASYITGGTRITGDHS